jgi:hypothetical protein
MYVFILKINNHFKINIIYKVHNLLAGIWDFTTLDFFQILFISSFN